MIDLWTKYHEWIIGVLIPVALASIGWWLSRSKGDGNGSINVKTKGNVSINTNNQTSGNHSKNTQETHHKDS